jgi:hypothetical protein
MDARVLLAEMRIRGERPKLGALCRWVRNLDVVSGLSMRRHSAEDVVVERSARDKELLLVLDGILRVTGPVDTGVDAISSPGPISVQQVWCVCAPSYDKVDREMWLPSATAISREDFSIIENTPGPLRKPPNRHPAILYASKDNAVMLCEAEKVARIHHHPIVPNLSLIERVMMPLECGNIVSAAETIGFLPDAPVVDGDNDDSSVLAHNFYWLVDEAFHGKLWERVRPYVPQQVGGRKVRGLNRRFRVYRYVPGAEYRCHIGK